MMKKKKERNILIHSILCQVYVEHSEKEHVFL